LESKPTQGQNLRHVYACSVSFGFAEPPTEMLRSKMDVALTSYLIRKGELKKSLDLAHVCAKSRGD
jgi:hypothetical protein